MARHRGRQPDRAGSARTARIRGARSGIAAAAQQGGGALSDHRHCAASPGRIAQMADYAGAVAAIKQRMMDNWTTTPVVFQNDTPPVMPWPPVDASQNQ